MAAPYRGGHREKETPSRWLVRSVNIDKSWRKNCVMMGRAEGHKGKWRVVLSVVIGDVMSRVSVRS